MHEHKGYRYLDDLTYADVAFAAEGHSLAELFTSATDALTNSMVVDLGTIAATMRVQENLRAVNEADLLHRFLQRLVFHKDVDQLLLRVEQLHIATTKDGHLQLDGTLCGEKIDPRKHELIVDVKAVTHHRFEVKKVGLLWTATVILDV